MRNAAWLLFPLVLSAQQELIDRARSLRPEFAAEALLRIAESTHVTDRTRKIELLAEALRLGAQAAEPYPRQAIASTHELAARFSGRAFSQGLDASTLQLRAVGDLLPLDALKARQWFEQIPPPRLEPLTCEQPLVFDVHVFYETAAEISRRGFTPKQIQKEEPFKFLARYIGMIHSPAQVTPAARAIASARLKPAQLEALVASFTAALQEIPADPRSFAASMEKRGAEQAVLDLGALCCASAVQTAWQSYQEKQEKAEACEAEKPVNACQTVACRELGERYTALLLTPEKTSSEWRARLIELLSTIADGKQDFPEKYQLFSGLFNATPSGAERELILNALLGFIQLNEYQREHPAEWFLTVNSLIARIAADPMALGPAMQQLERSPDPVIALFAELEKWLPRPPATLADLF